MNALVAQPELRARAGLGDLPARLRERPCTIAYLGASVTAQKDGYRPRLHALLSQATGHEHRAVAAGFGAMGSITGRFLMERFVMPHEPELAFVEYVTSDVAGTTPPELLRAALEGIVGRLREAGCEPCFLYLPRRDLDPRSSPVLEAYEDVAAYHGVPSIDLSAVSTEGPDPLLRDLVHTSDAGSALLAGAVARAFAELTPGPTPERLPLRESVLQHARIVTPTPALLRDGSRCETGSFRLVFPFVEIDSDNELEFIPEGDLAGLLVAVGPRSGYIELEAAGRRREYLLWDEWCSYERLSSVVFWPFAPAGMPVTLRVLDRPIERSDGLGPGGRRLKVLGLMERV
ncbi:MAG TPA: SGNH/GDSL hydrolase family protein [Gaiellaceae bacterium]|nr:SGNH/GDSL hydrolase family protein [Gaiellaceae bacterium]